MADAKPIEFVGSLEGARVDDSGEWTVTLKVPLQSGPQVAALALYMQESFKFSALPMGESVTQKAAKF